VIEISNLYGHGYGPSDLSKMEQLGFVFRPQVPIFDGAQACHFIDFASGPSLELIEVTDEGAYLEFVPEGMIPYCPGISLILPAESPPSLGEFAEEFADLRRYSLHHNYDGTQDPRMPGWNYLNFAAPIVQDTFIWLSEPDEPRPAKATAPSHPNGVQGVLGLVFDLDPTALDTLWRLADAESPEEGLRLGGVGVWTTGDAGGVANAEEKTFPLVAVVVEAKSLDYFERCGDLTRRVVFRSNPAILVSTNHLSWDLIITTLRDT
jgi:hypothetical protein